MLSVALTVVVVTLVIHSLYSLILNIGHIMHSDSIQHVDEDDYVVDRSTYVHVDTRNVQQTPNVAKTIAHIKTRPAWYDRDWLAQTVNEPTQTITVTLRVSKLVALGIRADEQGLTAEELATAILSTNA